MNSKHIRTISKTIPNKINIQLVSSIKVNQWKNLTESSYKERLKNHTKHCRSLKFYEKSPMKRLLLLCK